MHDLDVFLPLLIVMGSATVAATGFHYLRLPPIPGYILAGVLIGPYGLGWVPSLPGAEAITEIGVVLLMFTIGLELSLHHLHDLRRALLALGPLQVVLTLLAAAAAGRYLVGLTWNQGLVVGALVAMSSTAIGMKLLEEAGETQSALRYAVLGTLIFQDLATIPILIALPILADVEAGEGAALGTVLLGVGYLGGLALLSRFLLPRVLEFVARTGNREVFFSSIVLICFGVAYLSLKVGLSLSLGAFVAGLVVADSPYGRRATAEFAPLRDPVLGLFFTAVGMLLDARFVAAHAVAILAISAGLLLLKSGILYGALRALRYQHSVSLMATAAMFGLGEFSLVLAHAGSAANLLDAEQTQYILAVILISMIVTPFGFRASARSPRAAGLSGLLGRANTALAKPIRAPAAPENAGAAAPHGHTLIIGFGITGEDLAGAFRAVEIPYTGIDVDYDRVKQAAATGNTVIWGDATRVEVLEQAGIMTARQIVVAVSSPVMIPGILSAVRRLRPDVPIVLRLQYLRQADELTLSGPVDVVVQELETAIEILIKALHLYGVPQEQVRKLMGSLRQRLDRPDLLVPRAMRHALGLPEWGDQVLLRPLLIPPGSPAHQRTIAELNLRQRTGALIVAVFREGLGARVPQSTFQLQHGDVVQIIGSQECVQTTVAYLSGAGAAP
jgi:CPA2 family monovalent cation:H+ antiporter-2